MPPADIVWYASLIPPLEFGFRAPLYRDPKGINPSQYRATVLNEHKCEMRQVFHKKEHVVSVAVNFTCQKLGKSGFD
jgi:hypothetical protein